MKKLSKCSRGEKLKVLKLDASSELKQRLISFGIIKETVIEVLEHSPTKSTIEIKVGRTRIALRASEADKIEVENYE